MYRLARTRVATLPSLAREGVKFGIVGVVALLVDVGVFNLLRFAGGVGVLYDWPLAAKVLSMTAATVVAWWLNRTWTFRHRRRDSPHLELAMFVAVAASSMVISVGCLAVSHYVFGWQSQVADNISANVVGLALATLFRFWAYRRFVFNQRDPHVLIEPEPRVPDAVVVTGRSGSP